MPSRKRDSLLWKHLSIALCVLFAGFLILMVIIANRGEGDQWWSFIHRIPYGDKFGHVGLMATLGFLCNLAFARKPLCIAPNRATILLATIISIEECSQHFIPSRNFDPLDLASNLVGLTLGQWTAFTFLKIIHPTHRSPSPHTP